MNRREDEKEEVSSYWITLKKETLWRFEKEPLCVELALEETMDLWQHGLQNEWINEFRRIPNTYLITYLLTPRCRVLLEKLPGLQLVKKFPAFHGTQRFITALTSVRHLSLSWASPIQSMYPHPTSCRSILILSTHLRLGLPSGLLPSGFPSKTLYTPLSSPIRAKRPAHLILLDFITNYINYRCENVKSHTKFFLDCLTLEDGADILSRNVGDQLPDYAA